MPYITNTPESVLSHSVSRNPATTCRGITVNGLPCRRALGASPNSSPPRIAANKTEIQQNANLNTTALYCWQHKDQAESIIQQKTLAAAAKNVQKQPRTSIDTLTDRLGVLEIKDTHTRTQYTSSPSEKHRYKRKKPKRTFCCFEIMEEDELAPSRPIRPSTKQHGRPTPTPTRPQPRPFGMQHVPTAPPITPPARPQKPPTTSEPLLSWIPPSLTPKTTSLLLTELAKPISAADEPGYIYMFWVTPSTSSKSVPPPLDVASSLLPDANTNAESPAQIQRSNTAIRKARDLNTLTLSSKPTANSPGTVRLKIGRTSNVHRRLNEWTRQCSNHLTLIRYYPYISSSQQVKWERSNRGLEPGRKVLHVHRVERLIHIELADIRARDLGQCRECGKEHREWFEVAAERTALKRVDECIRRWVSWADTHA